LYSSFKKKKILLYCDDITKKTQNVQPFFKKGALSCVKIQPCFHFWNIMPFGQKSSPLPHVIGVAATSVQKPDLLQKKR